MAKPFRSRNNLPAAFHFRTLPYHPNRALDAVNAGSFVFRNSLQIPAVWVYPLCYKPQHKKGIDPLHRKSTGNFLSFRYFLILAESPIDSGFNGSIDFLSMCDAASALARRRTEKPAGGILGYHRLL